MSGAFRDSILQRAITRVLLDRFSIDLLTTAAQVGNQFKLAELPPAHLKGKQQPMRIFIVKR
jgi:hypothetical protein